MNREKKRHREIEGENECSGIFSLSPLNFSNRSDKRCGFVFFCFLVFVLFFVVGRSVISWRTV